MKRKEKRAPREKPISIPLDFDEALKAMLQTRPEPKRPTKKAKPCQR